MCSSGSNSIPTMRSLRAVARLALLTPMTLSFVLVWMCGKFLTTRAPQWRKPWRSWIIRNWARTVSRIVSMRIHTHGPLPEPPYFLVANHLSYCDIIAFASLLNCVFIAKAEISQWPALGGLASTIGTLYIDRSRFRDVTRVVSLIERTLAEGYGVLLFPEGTSTRGDRVLPFHPGLLEPAVRLGYPVYYASITYRTPPQEIPAHLSVCWWGDTPFLPHFFGLLKLKRFEATIRFADQPVQESNRKLLARRLWRGVSSDFVPVVEFEDDL